MLKNIYPKLEAQDFQQFLDEVIVSDENGNILWANHSVEKYYNISSKEIIGENVRKLVENGILKPSSVLLAIERREPVTVFQKTISDKYLMVTSIPIIENKKIKRVISILKDIKTIVINEEFYREFKVLLNNYEKYFVDEEKSHEKEQRLRIVSKNMQSVMNTVERVAKVDSTVLITGESGVGKTFIAKKLHKKSRRYNKPFVEINCGVLPESLIESELFGYEKGAFTGANSKGKKGFVEQAHTGTLFFDEIGELSPNLQVKLLKLIQDRSYTPIGATQSKKVDIRIIAATNKNLEKMVKNGKFREDLFYRLNVVPIHIPALRERKEDVMIYIKYFLNQMMNKYKIPKSLTEEALNILTSYHWPGNIRELQNMMERLVVVNEDYLIKPSNLPSKVFQVEHKGQQTFQPPSKDHDVDSIQVSLEYRNKPYSLKKHLFDIEKRILLNFYKKEKNTYKMAEILGISQASVVRKLQKFGIKK